MAASLAEVSDTMAAAATKKTRQSWRNLDILCVYGTWVDGGGGGGVGEWEWDDGRKEVNYFVTCWGDYPDSAAAKVDFRLK